MNAERVLVDLAQCDWYIPGSLEWMKSILLPYERQSLPREGRQWPRIEIGADGMRLGKTTAVAVLGPEFQRVGLPVWLSFEDWQNNPHLEMSYTDSSLAILNSQLYFAKRKFEQLKTGADAEIFIQDVHGEMDFGYALTNALLGRMRREHFLEYCGIFYALEWKSIPAPDLLVYLTASDDVLVERAQKTAREFETIDPTYFLAMKVVNRAWLDGVKKRMNVLLVDTDDFDFSTDGEAKRQLAEMVLGVLQQDGWDLEIQS